MSSHQITFGIDAMTPHVITYDVLQHVQDNFGDVLEPEQVLEISESIVLRWSYTTIADIIDDYVDVYRSDILKQSNA